MQQTQPLTNLGPRLGWRFLWVTVSCVAGIAPHALAQWPQWGGPNRDFTITDGPKLADHWPDGGPKKIWSGEIGGGHSSIVVDDGRLYTMCRRGDKDAVLAFDADTGKKIWETQYDAPERPDMSLEFGPGPHATPLVVGDRVYTAGAMVQFHCLDKNTGKILWSHDLSELFGTSWLLRGYGSSPIAYRDMVILNVGPARPAEGSPGIAALKQDTGEVVWKSESFGGGYPSPLIVNFNGDDLLINCLGTDRFGLDPATGEVKWRSTVDRQSAAIMASPLWIPPDRVFFSAGYGGGARLFKISVDAEGKFSSEELWHSPKMKIHHGNAICVGDTIYGSSGDFGPAFLMALDLATGDVLWRNRGFTKSNLLYADGKLIILDQEGFLALATATREGLEVHSKVKLLEEKSWTAPTLVGTRLYLRDYHTIMALDIGPDAGT